MAVPFEIPEWLVAQSAPPPPPPVDDHRVESLVNNFIAAKQDALFDAPDAYYRQRGADALDNAPAIAQRLQDLRSATLDLARDDSERAALGPRLDAHLDDAMDGIGRHVAAQRLVFQRNTLGTRQALIQRAAALEHDNDGKIAGLAEANASAARERARLDGVAPGSDAEADVLNAARSQILRTAIEQRIANARGAQAIDLHDRMADALTPADRRALELPIAAARDDTATDAWLTRQAGIDGPPLADRVASDDGLTDTQRLILRAKIGAQDSAAESHRVAAVKGLDDQLAAATKAIATQPPQYRTGTLNALAQAYADTGEPDQAADTRRLAAAEPILLPFAQANVATQQRRLDDFTGPDRTMAEAIMNHQAEAFAKDSYAAGTALYPDVGPTLPEEDAEARLRQTRMIEARRETAPQNLGEADASQHEAALARANFSPEPQMIAPGRVEPSADAGSFDSREVQVAQAAPDDATPIDTPRRGVAPPTEPPFHDPDLEKAFQQFPGKELVLSNGKWVADPSSPTGDVMTPFNDLKGVAAAARRAKEEHPGWELSQNIALWDKKALDELEAVLKTNLGQGGTFDYQRRHYPPGKGGLTQLRQFRSIANINVGLFAQQLGLSLKETLGLAAYYALKNSSNRNLLRPPYFLDADTQKYIETGYEIGEKRLFE
jgi:hypothetical protein